MTILATSWFVTVVFAILHLVSSIAGAAVLDARAQAAADAAALAAVAESTTAGHGAPVAAAHRFADANGARVVDCICEPGAEAVQVEVDIGGARARARAVVDFEALRPLALGYDREGLHPALRLAVERLMAAARGRVRVSSGYRSAERQRELWEDAIGRYGSPAAAARWVARPGSSMHERGLAVDLAGDVDYAARLVEQLRLPLHRPLPHEPWHFELAGSRG